MIKLDNLELVNIDYNNKEHLNFLKDLILSKDMNYLWDISDKDLYNNLNEDKYIVLNDKNEKIGYLNVSDVVEGRLGNTVSIYYAIKEEFRGNGYGSKLVSEFNDWLFNNKEVDYVIAQVDVKNIHSNYTLSKAGMEILTQDDEYITFGKKNK